IVGGGGEGETGFFEGARGADPERGLESPRALDSPLEREPRVRPPEVGPVQLLAVGEEAGLVVQGAERQVVPEKGGDQAVAQDAREHSALGIARHREQLRALSEPERVAVDEANDSASPQLLVVARSHLDAIAGPVLDTQDDAQPRLDGLYLEPQVVEERKGMDLVEGTESLREVERRPQRNVEGPAYQLFVVPLVAPDLDLGDGRALQLSRGRGPGRERPPDGVAQPSADLRNGLARRLPALLDELVEARVVVEAVRPQVRVNEDVGLHPGFPVRSLGQEAAGLGRHTEGAAILPG